MQVVVFPALVGPVLCMAAYEVRLRHKPVLGVPGGRAGAGIRVPVTHNSLLQNITTDIALVESG